MLLRKAAVLSARCAATVVLEPTGGGTWKIQARCCHHILRTVPVFPELQDYPTSVVVPRKIEKAAYIPRYREKEVQIQTCGKLYEKWRKERKYWSVPDGPVTFNVKYMDTGVVEGDTNNEAPIVVALHGSPGSYDDFTSITRHLFKNGARVVAPCFPDIYTYKRGRFRHSPDEKKEYVKDFLTNLDIPRIDMLMCHSSSLFPGLLLSLESHFPNVKSLCLLNPTGFDMPSVMRPYQLIKAFAKLYEFPLVMPIVDTIGRLIVGAKSQLASGHYTDHYLAAFTLVHSDVTERAVHFRRLVQKNLPILMIFSENDRLIAAKSSYKMAEMLVGSESEVYRYDGSGKLVKPGGINPSKRALAFEKGTHFSFSKHPDIISEEIKSFLFNHFKKN